MNFFEKILYLLDSVSIKTPTNYSWFHILCLLLVIVATIFICWKYMDCDDKKFRLISFIFWISIVILEIFKQLIFSFNYDSQTDTTSYHYQWYAFPCQFCSSPLFVLPIVIFFKNGKLRDCAISFISLFSLFAGIAVMLYPNDVFISTLYIDIQTMVHHGTQVILGIFYIVHSRKNIDVFYFTKALVVFVGMAICAFTLNEIMPKFIDGTFNMWFISRYYPNTLPVLSTIYANAPYFVFLISYFVGFAFVAFLINIIFLGIKRLISSKIIKKKKSV